ncbi:DUF3422 domain-containing protein [Marinomonas rhizomae]|uniref:Putative membrane-anchored protein n=1 Tax=Marinomonas rhizomae TaxID=491948 RepID=A0A366JFQ2_9GAMM|nr:DUF3422 domain-containing protein [Marinomonas rhizomae]RBP85801.1 putative membrane-anchored protein [Marinomonas rhizomae]RNF75582.1 DUF3422 domain-containing protein [Marinomonas rhizomae]
MNQVNNSYGLKTHPLRDALYAELHSRPFQVLPSPARISYLAVIVGADQKQAEFEHFCSLYNHFNGTPPENDSVCFEVDFGSFKLRRDKHLEFISYMIIHTQVDTGLGVFAQNALSYLPLEWLSNMPGNTIAAFHVAVEDARTIPEPDLALVKSHFEGMRLVGSRPQNGDAQVWTTFQLHSDGCGRFLIYNKRMSDSQLGRMVQRVVEIETYRLMALLALPMARKYNAELVAMDEELAQTTANLSDATAALDEQALLSELIDMAAWVEATRSKTSFRFSATRAYHELVLKRLNELKEDEVSGHLTITEFMTRRLTPAVRTCNTAGNHLESLSTRIDRVSDMMRTQVEMSIQSQNQQLLTSMDRRSKIQLAMQHTVEGLSVAAISYYSVGLLKFLIEAVYDKGVHFDKSLVIGLSVPLVVGGVWLATRKIHKRFLLLAKAKEEK